MNDARWPDAMAVDSLGGTGASPARAVKFKIRGFRTRSFQKVTVSAVERTPYLVISAVVAGGGTSGRGDRPEGLKEPLDSGCREGGS